MSDLIIFGTGELGEVADFYFREDSPHNVVAFTVDGAHVQEDSFAGRPVVAFEDLATAFPPESAHAFAAIGYSKVNAVRRMKCEALRAAGYTLESYISSRATTFSNLRIGDNAFVLEDNTIQPFVTMGNGVTLWSGNHIGHHVTIGDYAFVSSHVVVSGGVTIGDGAFLGVNATINDHLEIGARCVVGSGAVIAKGLGEAAVAIAEPARIAKITSDRLRGM